MGMSDGEEYDFARAFNDSFPYYFRLDFTYPGCFKRIVITLLLSSSSLLLIVSICKETQRVEIHSTSKMPVSIIRGYSRLWCSFCRGFRSFIENRRTV